MTPSSKQISNNMLEQWIFPIFGEYSGQCFIIDSYLITAAHVIAKNKEPYTVLWNNQRMSLCKKDAILYELTEINENYRDYAVFALPQQTESPLHLMTLKDFAIELSCYFKVEENFRLELRSSNAIMDKVYSDSFFTCTMHSMIFSGRSGCPLIDIDNNVVGMLVAGDDKSICAFQSAAYIKKILEQCLAN